MTRIAGGLASLTLAALLGAAASAKGAEPAPKPAPATVSGVTVTAPEKPNIVDPRKAASSCTTACR